MMWLRKMSGRSVLSVMLDCCGLLNFRQIPKKPCEKLSKTATSLSVAFVLMSLLWVKVETGIYISLFSLFSTPNSALSPFLASLQRCREHRCCGILCCSSIANVWAIDGSLSGSWHLTEREVSSLTLSVCSHVYMYSVCVLLCVPVWSKSGQPGIIIWCWSPSHTLTTFISFVPYSERLKHTGAARLRHMHHPDEQYGIILNFDTVITNTRMLQSICWQQLAKAHGTVIPPLQNSLVLFNTRPERVIMDVSYISVDHFFLQQMVLVKFCAYQLCIPTVWPCCICHTDIFLSHCVEYRIKALYNDALIINWLRGRILCVAHLNESFSKMCHDRSQIIFTAVRSSSCRG